MRVETHVHIGKARKGEDDCISVRDLPNGRVYYRSYIRMRNVSLVVQPAGLRKFRESGQKNVHAFVRGDKVVSFIGSNSGALAAVKADGFRRASYNPAKNHCFVDAENGNRIDHAREAVIVGKDLFYR